MPQVVACSIIFSYTKYLQMMLSLFLHTKITGKHNGWNWPTLHFFSHSYFISFNNSTSKQLQTANQNMADYYRYLQEQVFTCRIQKALPKNTSQGAHRSPLLPAAYCLEICPVSLVLRNCFSILGPRFFFSSSIPPKTCQKESNASGSLKDSV